MADRSNEISGIITVISDISEQTYLLPLNAAIEASRAGEAGKGFAVIADEVIKLAEQTDQSTAQVVNIIEDIQADSQSANTSMSTGRKELEQSLALIKMTQESFIKILAVANNVDSEETNTIAQFLNNQVDELNQLITDLQQND